MKVELIGALGTHGGRKLYRRFLMERSGRRGHLEALDVDGMILF